LPGSEVGCGGQLTAMLVAACAEAADAVVPTSPAVDMISA